MKLAKLQEKFIKAIYDETNLDIFVYIKSRGIPKEELLGVYRNNLEHNLVNSLKLTFENVLRFLKENRFIELAKEFVFKNPSRSNNLDYYGDCFDEFLSLKEGEFIADVARLDWFRQKSYLAKNDVEVDLASLRNIGVQELFDLKFTLSDSVFLLESDYNLLASRKQNAKTKRKSYFMVRRTKISGVYEVESLRIQPQEFQFLKGIISDLTLYEIYEKYEVDIQSILQKFLSNGVIVSFK